MKKSDTQLKVTWMPTDELIPYANNPKEHPPEQVEQIAASIQAFGFIDPVAVDENNIVVEGHGRLLAAQQLGLKKVPVICLSHLSEAERKAYALAHNKLTLNSGWDVDRLQLEFSTLQTLEFENLELTGFSLAELDGFFLEDSEGAMKTEAQENESEKTDVSIQYQNQYGVIVQCESEAQQERIYTELSEAGYSCKVVTV